jgi:hypothetical protein
MLAVRGMSRSAPSSFEVVKQTGIVRPQRLRQGGLNDVCERSCAGEEIDEGVSG